MYKKYRKYLWIYFILIMLTGCRNKSEKLAVFSTDYYNLREIEAEHFDIEMASTWYLNENPYKDYSCYVTEKDSKIFIQNYSPDNSSHIFKGDYGYFLGTDIEYDGWVRYYPYNSGVLEIESTVVAKEHCIGFIAIDNRKGYLLTYNPFFTDNVEGNLYELVCNYENGSWSWNVISHIEDIPLGFTYSEEDNVIYIVAAQSIIAVDNDANLSILKKTDFPQMIGLNSIVELSGSLYCGSPMGIYEFRISTGEEFWYPIHYEKYVR